jgi:hypothetical protein
MTSETVTNAEEVREDISQIVAASVAAMKNCIKRRNGYQDLFSLPVRGKKNVMCFFNAQAVISTACFLARESKAFRREWEIEAEKHGVTVSQDPTELVVSLLYKLADGDVSSSRNLQSWINMFQPADLLPQTLAGQAGSLI